MAPPLISVVRAGLVTSVGLCAPATCAAIRARISNHTPTRFFGASGEWTVGAQVPLPPEQGDRVKLAKMLALAVEECLDGASIPLDSVPLLLCLAERDRPGTAENVGDYLISSLERELPVRFHSQLSGVIRQGRIGTAVALGRARTLFKEFQVPHVLIAATDSLIVGPTLRALEKEERLLTDANSNGFVPGEAAGAVLVAQEPSGGPRLVCRGLGFADESATIYSGEPLRADGLAHAVSAALADAACEMHDLDFRITDNSGEQYYFKEAALALMRTLRRRKEEFDIWHPAECVGEVGAASGLVALSVALASGKKAYAPGRNVLWHAGLDTGERCAVVARYEE